MTNRGQHQLKAEKIIQKCNYHVLLIITEELNICDNSVFEHSTKLFDGKGVGVEHNLDCSKQH